MLHVLSEKPSRDAIVAPYVTERQWAQIKQRNYQWAKEALIGKKREHVPIKEVLSTFSKHVKSESAHHSFVTDEILVKSGDPVELILKTADVRNCDIIVMGSHGHGVIEKALIGSTTKKVVQRSKKPVLVVRLPE
jgi:nucleotide-binding universal stress UspA family protein